MSSSIQKKAERIVRDYAMDQAPVSLFKICEALHINFLKLEPLADRKFIKKNHSDPEKTEGFAHLRTDGRKVIKVFIDPDNLAHTRLVAAHEIGHHVLNHLKRGDVLFSTRTLEQPEDDKEACADEFARHLLVPMHLLKRFVQDIGVSDFKVLASIFDVEEGLIQMQLACWQAEESPDFRKLFQIKNSPKSNKNSFMKILKGIAYPVT